MTKKTQRWHNLARLPLVAAVAATVSAPVHAFQFFLGEIEGALDTQLTAGASWRVADRDENQLGQGNLGVLPGNKGSATNNIDDGNWNFKKGETYSKVVKGTTDLSLSYEDFGAFTRARYFYDFELMDEHRANDNVGQTRPLNEDALDQAGADAEILDAFVYGNFELGDMPLNLRAGRQVVSWGESTFIPGGINAINPVDLAAFRSPGAEIKDVLLPVNMIYGSLGLTTELSVEAFYQLEWEKTRIDPCGTYFSTLDFVADGCGPVLLAGQLSDGEALAQGLISERLGDREPDDKGQFGVAFRYFADALGGAEFGFYYMNYHSRVPVVSGILNNPRAGDNFPEYYLEYPEDIQLFGISMATTTENGYSIGAEISHRRDLPVSWNAFELITAGVQAPYSLLLERRKEELGITTVDGADGLDAPGWDPYNVTQAQMTIIKFYEQVLGASRLTVAGEIGATYIHGFPGVNEARYGRSSTFGIADFDPINMGDGTFLTCDGSAGRPAQNNNPSFCSKDGFTTAFSWGYRARFALDYNDVFAGVNLIPLLAWSHDVNGYAPEPGGAFLEGSKSVGLSLRAVYLNQYTAEVGYTNFFGGKPYNLLNDRDFVSASVSVSF